MFNRSLHLPTTGAETFFLWGPRQAGKTTLLKQRYPRGRWIDLLRSEEFRRYATRPELLRLEIEAEPPDPARKIVIDEIQKVPALLDEVHGLIEGRKLCFALCGSSARKVRRGAANLLGGRALRFELLGLTAHELGSAFDLERISKFLGSCSVPAWAAKLRSNARCKATPCCGIRIPACRAVLLLETALTGRQVADLHTGCWQALNFAQ